MPVTYIALKKGCNEFVGRAEVSATCILATLSKSTDCTLHWLSRKIATVSGKINGSLSLSHLRVIAFQYIRYNTILHLGWHQYFLEHRHHHQVLSIQNQLSEKENLVSIWNNIDSLRKFRLNLHSSRTAGFNIQFNENNFGKSSRKCEEIFSVNASMC